MIDDPFTSRRAATFSTPGAHGYPDYPALANGGISCKR